MEGCALFSGRTGTWALATILVLVTSACGSELPVVWRGTIDTLENGVVMVRNPAEGIWDESSAWRLVEAVKIGARDGLGPQVFGDIGDIDVDPFGRIYVLDKQAQEIRVFESNGSYIRAMGRHGRGPGEFYGVRGIAIDRDGRVWAGDQNNNRYSVFDSSGALVKEMRRPFAGVGIAEWVSVITPAGDLYEVIGYMTLTGPKLGLARYDTIAMEFVDTTSLPRQPDARQWFGWYRSTLTSRGWWVGRADRYRLWQETRDGDRLRIVEREYTPPELSAAERDSADQYHRDLERRARGSYSDPGVPEHQRIFQSMVEDDEGYLWVLLTPEQDAVGSSLDVFDPEGRYLGGVIAPDRVEPRPLPVIRGDKIHYVTRDELDVQYVVRMRIER